MATLDGVNIAEGNIVFFPAGDNKGPAAGGTIKGGQYSITAAQGPVVGCNRVEIRASRKSGRKMQMPLADPGVMTDELVEAVPSRYNSQSTLECEMKPGNNSLDFTLTTTR
jgi:hypothetical protein